MGGHGHGHDDAHGGGPERDENGDIICIKAEKHHKYKASGVLLACIGVVILMSSWKPRQPRHDVHHAKMLRNQAHIASPMYGLSSKHPEGVVIPVDPERPRELLDIKLVAPCADECPGGDDAHRRLSVRDVSMHVRRLKALNASTHSIKWELLANDKSVTSGKLGLAHGFENEAYVTVNPSDYDLTSDDALSVRLTTDSVKSIGVMCEVVQMNALGKNRVIAAAILFICTFGLLLSEVINKCYVTFLGSITGLFIVSLVNEMPHLPTIVSMIDFGTLMLLFAMMMNVHILAVTGFFAWFSVRLAASCAKKKDEEGNLVEVNMAKLFFALANITGFLSAFLDNVTCVLLMGPITISLCKQMGADPVPFYLAQTICATVGGTATFIGDPPNVVVGNKLKIPFMDFIINNGPLVAIILPLTSLILYFRFRDQVSGKVEIDLRVMKRDNPVIDEVAFLYAAAVFAGIAAALFTSPIHKVEPAWFCLVGFFGLAMVVERHKIRGFLESVEWDTLLFFAQLFVFVECLAELGLIRAIGDFLTSTIAGIDPSSRFPVAMLLVLWVSAIGSAFLESLPYTTTITYIIIGLIHSDNLGMPVEPLCWPLSVGACIGGIGSIMGSSANLVAMAVSRRYSPDNCIQGGHFLKYGFPALVCITLVASLYQYIVFSHIYGYKADDA